MSNEPRLDVCGRCKAYNKVDSTCRLQPPAAQGYRWQWPEVNPTTDWCRQWESDGSHYTEFLDQMVKEGRVVEGV